jgi:hypothetical protein
MEKKQRVPVIDLDDLFRLPHEPQVYDSGYRSGFREGWVACLDAMAKGLSAHAYEAAWHFWEHELREWLFQEPSTRFFPPDFDYKPERSSTRRSLPTSLRFAILKRDNYRCQICGVAADDGPEVRLHVDHKKAHSKGGPAVADNLWTLCAECNGGKYTQDL